MNVYDFDKTIYNGDSSLDFFKFCLLKKPALLKHLYFQFFSFLLYVLGVYNKTKFKECFFVFLNDIEDIDTLIKDFWLKHKVKIFPWYLSQKKSSDVIISASPEFLLNPLTNALGIKLIASVICKKSGKFTGENCYGKEKLRRFFEKYPQGIIDNFYSDSISDKYMASIACNSYLVTDGKISNWNNSKHRFFHLKSREFLSFLFIGGLNAVTGIFLCSIISLFLNPNLSFFIGYLLSLITSYFLNTKITFRNSFNSKKLIKFIISYIPNFIIQNIIVAVFYNILGINKFIVYTLSTLLTTPITFIFLKLYTYKE